jgi:digalactosyldiacylglycerol synthase
LLGKKHWAKGYRELLNMVDCAEGRALLDEMGPIHLIGSGPDENSIHGAFTERLGSSRVVLRGFEDHIELGATSTTPSVFVNPSTSEVLCTATAEALAMGKTAVIPFHP